MSEMNSFQDAFYIMAKELGFDYAQPLSPREVFETQMLPRIKELVAIQPAAGEPDAPKPIGYISEQVRQELLHGKHVPANICTATSSRRNPHPGPDANWSVPIFASPPAAVHGDDFQARVQPWMLECFGEVIAGDRQERNHRFLEEALELVQSTGCTASEAHQLVDYVFGRPAGEPDQEVGGVMVTLAALCLANNDLDMRREGYRELARVWTKVDAIRAKQAAKPNHSPLPVAAAHGDDASGTVRVTAGWLKKVHRDLDACQKVIWLAGCRPHVPGGFDPAYCEDAQTRLKEIDEQIARALSNGKVQR